MESYPDLFSLLANTDFFNLNSSFIRDGYSVHVAIYSYQSCSIMMLLYLFRGPLAVVIIVHDYRISLDQTPPSNSRCTRINDAGVASFSEIAAVGSSHLYLSASCVRRLCAILCVLLLYTWLK